MIVGHGFTRHFLIETLKGNVDWDANSFKLAFFTNEEDLSPATTTQYATSANEVVDGTIPQGGVLLDPVIMDVAGESPYIEFSDLELTGLQTSTVVRGGILYQETPNIAIAIINFEEDKTSTNGSFFVRLAKQDLGTPLIAVEGSDNA